MHRGFSPEIVNVQQVMHAIITTEMPTHPDNAIQALLTELERSNRRFQLSIAFNRPNVDKYLREQLEHLDQLKSLDEALFAKYHAMVSERIAPYVKN